MKAIALVVALLAGCHDEGTIVRELVAVGAEGALPRDFLFGPTGCEVAGWRADRAGPAVIPCKDGRIEVEVEPVATLVIVAPFAVRANEVAEAKLIARDGLGRELRLGDRAPIEWVLPPALAMRSDTCRHGDMDFLCGAASLASSSPAIVAFRAEHVGRATIEARWRDARATFDIEVQP